MERYDIHRHLRRSTWPLSLALALVTCSHCTAPGARSRPSFVLILVDALRADHLTPWGYPRGTSPFLAGLAAQGVVFRRAYSQSSQTFLSTATLLTSSYFPYVVSKPEPRDLDGAAAEKGRQAPAEFPILADENLLLFERFQQAGYRTAGFFTNPHHHPESGFWAGLDHALYLPPEGEVPYAGGRAVNVAVDAWMDGFAEDAPFFLYIHYMDVHNPYRPPPEYARGFVTVLGEDKYQNAVPTREDVPSPEDLAYMIALYDASIRHVDDVIREVHDAVRSRFPRRETVFTIASDHGDEFMEHGGLGHGRTLEHELVHVPLLLAGSEELPRGARIERPVRNLDIGPTLLDLAGLAVPDEIDGRSLVTDVRQAGGSPAPPSFARYAGVQSITTERWHLLLNRRTGTSSLYDLERDPEALDDVRGRHPAHLGRLVRQLDRFEESYREHLRVSRTLDRLKRGEEVAVPPGIRDQLEALGYLQ